MILERRLKKPRREKKSIISYKFSLIVRGETTTTKIKKSEEFRNALRAARGLSVKENNEKAQQEQEAPKKEAEPNHEENKENPDNVEKPKPKQTNFLKRKSKAMAPQKVINHQGFPYSLA